MRCESWTHLSATQKCSRFSRLQQMPPPAAVRSGRQRLAGVATRRASCSTMVSASKLEGTSVLNRGSQDRIRQDKTRQDKTRQDDPTFAFCSLLTLAIRRRYHWDGRCRVRYGIPQHDPQCNCSHRSGALERYRGTRGYVARTHSRTHASTHSRTHALTHPRLTWCTQTGSSLMPSHGLHRSARLTPPLRCCCRPSCVLLLSALLTVQVRRLRWKCTVFLQFHHYR
jgi:hypothetical protein